MRNLTDKEGEVRELTAEDLKHFRPIQETDPGMLEAVANYRKRGRPRLKPRRKGWGSGSRRRWPKAFGQPGGATMPALKSCCGTPLREVSFNQGIMNTPNILMVSRTGHPHG